MHTEDSANPRLQRKKSNKHSSAVCRGKCATTAIWSERLDNSVRASVETINKSSPLSQPAFPPASAALNSPEQKLTLRLWIKPPLRTEKGARILHVHRRTTARREQQSAGQEGLQKPKKAVCLMGKLQVVILCMSAHVKKNVLPQSRLITVVAATCSYISRKNIKLQCRFNAHNWSFSHGFTKKWL